MGEMTYTDEELAWAIALIKPELPDYDEKDHQIAMLRFCLGELTEELCNVYYAMDESMVQDRLLSYEDARTQLGRILYTPEGDGNMPDGTSQEEIDAYAKKRGWEQYKSFHLDDYHCGDCTAVPASCMKCHAEQYYNFRTPYEGKHAGWKALHIYLDHMSKINAAEGETS